MTDPIVHFRVLKPDGTRGATYCGIPVERDGEVWWCGTGRTSECTCMDCYDRYIRSKPAKVKKGR